MKKEAKVNVENFSHAIRMLFGENAMIDAELLKRVVDVVQPSAAGEPGLSDAKSLAIMRAEVEKLYKPAPEVRAAPSADLRCATAVDEDQFKVIGDAVKMFSVLTKAAEKPPSFSYRAEDALQANLLDQIYYWQRQSFFPQGTRGDVSDDNGLFRMNWFNGRFLTAEALRRQDAYWDIRNRLPAQIHPAGIAWGLGVKFVPKVTTGGLNSWIGKRKPLPGTQALQYWLSLEDNVVLEPGLAFDPAGRPILVGRQISFQFQTLLDNYRRQPRKVAIQQTDFLPCVCLEAIDTTPTGPGPAISEGAYLLVIEPEERLDGEAKVYGELCENQSTVNCQADGWRGGFGLSLVRYTVQLPQNIGNNPWELRGELAAHYFYVFEHNLSRRWDPPFLRDDGFCQGTGAFRHPPAAVPLAMVYIQQDGSVTFFDPWIPRRTLAATAAETSHLQTLGAPKPSAAYARLHQFQCQLRENLLENPLLSTETITSTGLADKIQGKNVFMPKDNFSDTSMVKEGQPVKIYLGNQEITEGKIAVINQNDHVQIVVKDSIDLGNNPPNDYEVRITDLRWQLSKLNLYNRGFRYIPPVGFLPVELKLQHFIDGLCDRKQDHMAFGAQIANIQMLPFCLVKQQAMSYFTGTNVFPYFVAALHDDDIFEDVQNAFYKDPITIEQRRLGLWQFPDACNWMRMRPGNLGIFQSFMQKSRSKEVPFKEFDFTPAYPMAMLAQAVAIFMSRFDLDQIVNRHLELVKVIIPLQGIQRLHPLNDTADLNDKLIDEWLAGIDDGNLRAMVEKLLQQQDSIIGSLPRHFAVYVKQRVMLLDTIYLLMELLQQIQLFAPDLMGFMLKRDHESYKNVDVDALREQFATVTEDKRAVVQVLLSDEIGQQILAESILSASDELRISGRWEDFWTLVEETDKSLEPTIPNEDKRRINALENAVEDFSLEYPEYALLKPIIAMAPSSLAAESILQRASRKSGMNPALDAHGKPKLQSVDKELIHPERFRGWDKDSRRLYAVAREAMTARKVSEIANIQNDTPLESILRLSNEEAVELLGKDDYKKLKTSLSKDTKKLAENIKLISAEPPREKWVKRYNELLVKYENDEQATLTALKTEYKTNAKANEYLKRFGVMKKLLGDATEASLARRLFSEIRI